MNLTLRIISLALHYGFDSRRSVFGWIILLDHPFAGTLWCFWKGTIERKQPPEIRSDLLINH